MSLAAIPPSELPELTPDTVAPAPADLGKPGEADSQKPILDDLLSFKKETSTSMRCDVLAPADRGMGTTGESVQFVAQVFALYPLLD